MHQCTVYWLTSFAIYCYVFVDDSCDNACIIGLSVWYGISIFYFSWGNSELAYAYKNAHVETVCFLVRITHCQSRYNHILQNKFLCSDIYIYIYIYIYIVTC
jgi:hypothetical protein